MFYAGDEENDDADAIRKAAEEATRKLADIMRKQQEEHNARVNKALDHLAGKKKG